jgi:hypothetical protein
MKTENNQPLFWSEHPVSYFVGEMPPSKQHRSKIGKLKQVSKREWFERASGKKK